MRLFLIFIAGYLIALAPATAQTEIAAPADAVWLHAPSEISVPTTLGGWPRTSISDFSEGQHNVVIRYGDAAKASIATLFIFRAGVKSPSIWADRAMAAMLANTRFGTPVDGSLYGGVFTPPNGSGSNSGVMISTALTNDVWKSNGLLMFGHDDWLIKIRLTSNLDQAEGQALLVTMMKEMGLGRSSLNYPPAQMIEACPNTLRTGKNAKLEHYDAMGSLLLGAMLVQAMEKGLPQFEPATDMCRDASSSIEFGTYRASTFKGGYLLAAGDAGNSVSVNYIGYGGSGLRGRGYLAVMNDGVSQSAFGPFSKLPSPDIVLGFVTSATPIVSRSLLEKDAKNSTITVPGR